MTSTLQYRIYVLARGGLPTVGRVRTPIIDVLFINARAHILYFYYILSEMIILEINISAIHPEPSPKGPTPPADPPQTPRRHPPKTPPSPGNPSKI